MKKNIAILFVLCIALLTACEKPTISFLNAKNLKYPLNSMTIVTNLTEADMYIPDGVNPGNGGGGGFPGFPGFPGGPGGGGAPGGKRESKYKVRIENKSPWRSASFYGATVEGARPLTIEIEEIKTKGEKADAEKLRKVTTIIGEGIFNVPFENDIPEGEYLISLKISNISGKSEVVKDCFTIIVTGKRDW